MTLPLDTFRASLGLPPWAFWGFGQATAGQPASINSKCSTLTFQYDWQGSDAAGRSSIREAIESAEELFRTYVGYRALPTYVDYALVDWPRYYEADLSRWYDADATGRRVAVEAPEGFVLAMGIESLVSVGTAAVTYSAQFHPTFEDTFTLTIAAPAGLTDPDEVAVYFTTADRFDDLAVGQRWRVEPVQVSISGGNAVIVGRKWLVARPILYENPIGTMLDPTDNTNFVTDLDVYWRTTDGSGNTVSTAQSTLVYETNDCGACWGQCCCGSGTSASDPGTTGEVIARAGIRNSELGLITPAAATYDASSATWSSLWCCSGSYCDPDRVKLRYLAGYPLENNQIARRFRDPLVFLAAAELKRRICACREVNEKLHDLQLDMTLESTQSERYVRPQSQLENPFGTRLGHIRAWLAVKDHILRRGVSV